MTDNIVQFPKPDEILYTCACGCCSFFIHHAGSIECCNCGEYHEHHATDIDVSIGEWVKRLPDVPDVIERTDAGTMKHTATASTEFARKVTIREIEKWSNADQLGIIAAFKKDGTGRHWCNDEISFAVRKLKELIQYLEARQDENPDS